MRRGRVMRLLALLALLIVPLPGSAAEPPCVDADGILEPSDPRVYYQHDAQGVVGLVDEAGVLVEGYTPYGDVTVLRCDGSSVRWDGSDEEFTTADFGGCGSSGGIPVSPNANVWFFNGRELDYESGTYHYRARNYHPGLGQFMNADPLGAWGDGVNLGNPYAYVGNNPATFSDPTGEWAVVDDTVDESKAYANLAVFFEKQIEVCKRLRKKATPP